MWGLGGLLVLLFWIGPGAASLGRPAGDPPLSDPVARDPSPGVPPPGSATADATVPPLATTTAPAFVDVVVYGTQTSGLTAVREITREDPELRVAVVSSGAYLESPLAQGLSVEDARNVPRVAGGAYQEWREAVMARYQGLGEDPVTPTGRFAYQPDVASSCLWSFLQGSQPGQVLFYIGSLVAASDTPGDCHVDLRLPGGSAARIDTRFFIDASVEADLARMLGASYRIGRTEDLYNDRDGPVPPSPSEANGFCTAPQRFSVLLTLRVYPSGAAPALPFPGNLESKLAGRAPARLSSKAVEGFAHSWTMDVARLPGGGRELNETWNDYPDQPAAFQWIFSPEERPTLAQAAVQRSLDLVGYLQAHGYAEVGVGAVPEYPYVREGPRVVGLTTYMMPHIVSGDQDQPVAVGCYTLYDRHDALPPNQIDKTTWVQVPMGALLAAGHPLLLVSTAISTSYRAYSSPVRTELARANIGGAAGVIAVLAARLGTTPSQVPYPLTRALLRHRGYRVP